MTSTQDELPISSDIPLVDPTLIATTSQTILLSTTTPYLTNLNVIISILVFITILTCIVRIWSCRIKHKYQQRDNYYSVTREKMHILMSHHTARLSGRRNASSAPSKRKTVANVENLKNRNDGQEMVDLMRTFSDGDLEYEKIGGKVCKRAGTVR